MSTTNPCSILSYLRKSTTDPTRQETITCALTPWVQQSTRDTRLGEIPGFSRLTEHDRDDISQNPFFTASSSSADPDYSGPVLTDLKSYCKHGGNSVGGLVEKIQRYQSSFDRAGSRSDRQPRIQLSFLPVPLEPPSKAYAAMTSQNPTIGVGWKGDNGDDSDESGKLLVYKNTNLRLSHTERVALDGLALGVKRGEKGSKMRHLMEHAKIMYDRYNPDHSLVLLTGRETDSLETGGNCARLSALQPEDYATDMARNWWLEWMVGMEAIVELSRDLRSKRSGM